MKIKHIIFWFFLIWLIISGTIFIILEAEPSPCMEYEIVHGESKVMCSMIGCNVAVCSFYDCSDGNRYTSNQFKKVVTECKI